MAKNQKAAQVPTALDDNVNDTEDGWEDVDDDDQGKVTDSESEDEEDLEEEEEERLPLPIEHNPRFPASSETGWPHIISLDFDEDHNSDDLTLADGVATFLYNYEKKSGKTGLLDKFFGREGQPGLSNGSGHGKFRVTEFGFESDQEGRLQIFVSRNRQGVLAGLRDKDRTWEKQVSYRIDPDGRWVPLGSYGLYTPERLARDERQINRDGTSISTVMLLFRSWNPEYNKIVPFEYQ